MRKKLLPLILVCCMLAALFAVSVTAADDIVASGDCGASGSNVKWSLDDKGNLSITGTGAMKDYNNGGPWTKNSSIITSLTISDGVTDIGEYSFYSLSRLAKVSIPDSVTRIKKCAFRQCSSLTKITFPDGVSNIEDAVFGGCSNLLSFTISDNVASIGMYAFQNCARLTNMVIPKSVKSISREAFSGCSKLQSVTILGECPIINIQTFAHCSVLEEITLPDSVLIIEKSAFSNCTALKNVYYAGTEDMWKEINVDSGNEPLDNAAIHADTSPEAAYRINGITVSDNDGKPLSALPDGSFLATVSITNRVSGTSPVIFLAAYSSDGKFQDFAYVTVKEPIGATVEVTLPIDNSAGNIAELKAFAVSSIGAFTPIGAPVSYP